MAIAGAARRILEVAARNGHRSAVFHHGIPGAFPISPLDCSRRSFCGAQGSCVGVVSAALESGISARTVPDVHRIALKRTTKRTVDHGERTVIFNRAPPVLPGSTHIDRSVALHNQRAAIHDGAAFESVACSGDTVSGHIENDVLAFSHRYDVVGNHFDVVEHSDNRLGPIERNGGERVLKRWIHLAANLRYARRQRSSGYVAIVRLAKDVVRGKRFRFFRRVFRRRRLAPIQKSTFSAAVIKLRRRRIRSGERTPPRCPGYRWQSERHRQGHRENYRHCAFQCVVSLHVLSSPFESITTALIVFYLMKSDFHILFSTAKNSCQPLQYPKRT